MGHLRKFAAGVVVALAMTSCGERSPSENSEHSVAAADNPEPARRSSFGVYEGYDPVLYTEFVRESVYVPMRDGVRLAVDIFRPAVDGAVHLLSDGVIRASYARVGEPPFDNLGLPWRPAEQADVEAATPLNDTPLHLELALHPIANHFEKDSRIRLVITGADADNNLTIPYSPAPTQSIRLGGDKPAHIKLPTLIVQN